MDDKGKLGDFLQQHLFYHMKITFIDVYIQKNKKRK